MGVLVGAERSQLTGLVSIARTPIPQPRLPLCASYAITLDRDVNSRFSISFPTELVSSPNTPDPSNLLCHC